MNDWAPFLVSLATRRAIDRLRHRARTQERFRGIHDTPEPVGNTDCPVQTVWVRELLDRIRQEVGLLPGKQAEAIWLSGVEGLSHEQIAAFMQITTNEVGVLIHRARAHLRAALANTPRGRNL